MPDLAIPFQLSDPGVPLGLDPAMREYLLCYNFPQPPAFRYGYTRFESQQTRDRVLLFGQAWLPEHALGTIFLQHGYGEHSGNFPLLVQNLLQANFAVAAMDLRGHGLSQGPRAHLSDPNFYAEDLQQFISGVVPVLLPNKPIFLWAHSLGALVALQVILQNKPSIKSAVLTSPLLGFPPLVGAQKVLASLVPILAKLVPSFPIAHGIQDRFLSHDQKYLAVREHDPLILQNTTPLWFQSISSAVSRIQESGKAFQNLCPTLLLLAGDEHVTNLTESRKFAFQAYSSSRHKVIEFPGYYHELEKELELRERVVAESIAWLRMHV